MECDVKIPKNLAARISECVEKRAPYIERKVILMLGLYGSLSILLTFYAITDFSIYVIQSDFFGFLLTMFNEPSILFSGVGFNAFMERLPIFSLLIFLLSGLFMAKSLSKLLYINAQNSHEKVA